MANRFLNNISINDQYTLPASDGSANQVLATNGSGQLSFVDQSGGASLSGGAANKIAIWSGTDALTNDTNLHWDTTNDRLGIGTATPATTLHVNGRAVIGENNTIGSSYVTHTNIIGRNNNTANTGVTTGTSVILGDGDGGRYGNVVISERTLKLGTDDNVANSSSNSTAIIDINNNWKAGSAYSNIRGFLGYFTPPATGYDIYWFYANDNNSLTDSSFGAGNAPEAAIMQISFSPNFGTNSAGNSSNTNSVYFAGNASSAGAVYITASNQNTSSRGVVTIDGRYRNQNYEIPDGQKIFEVTSGYGRTKFVVESGGQNNEASIGIQKDVFHLGDTDTFFGFTGADTFAVTTGGTQRLSIGNSGATFSDSVTFSSSITVNGQSTFSDPATFDSDLTLDGISSMTETTALVMNGGNEVGYRTLGSNAFNSTSFLTEHPNISAASSVDNSNGNVIQDVTLDSNGHVTALGSVNLDDRYYQKSTSDSRYVNVTGDTMTGDLYLGSNQVDFKTNGSSTVPNFFGHRSSVDLDTRFTSSDGGWGYTTFDSGSSNTPSSGLHNANGLLSFNSHSGNYGHQIAMTTNTAKLYFRTRNNSSWQSWQQVFTDAYHPNADAWTTARTITLSGDLNGSVSLDGSADVTLSAQVVNNSHTHDDRYIVKGGSWHGLNMPGSRHEGVSSAGGEFVLSKNNPNNGQMSVLIDGNYYAGENNGFYSLYSSNNYNAKSGFYADSSGNTQFSTAGSYLQANTAHGYIQIGPMNTSWAHIYTDRPNFYFNKELYVNNQRVYHTGYHPEADTLTTARTIAGSSFDGSANIDISYNNLTNLPTIPSGSSLVRVYQNQDYVASSSSTSNRGNFGAGLTVYEGFNSGANRPFTYDTTLQIMSTTAQGFEIAADWVSSSSTPLKVRSLRDCCQGWSPWINIWTEHNFTGTNISNWNTAYGWGNHASAGYLTGSPTSITVGGILLEDSSDRSGLLEVNQKGSSGWSGIQIVDGSNRWSYMGNNNNVGIYDDYNGEWILLYNVNAEVELYYNGTMKMWTRSNGIGISGGISSTGSWNYTNGSYGTQTLGYYYGAAYWKNSALTYYVGDVTGTSSTQNQLYVKGAIAVGSASASNTYGRIDASNDIVAYSSDKRLKENILPINGALDKISKLSGFTYNWNEKAKEEAAFNTEERLVGVFAQDVQEVLPEAVKIAPFDNDGNDVSKSGENYLTVQYEKIVPLLIEGIKEQQAQIDELTTILEQLTKQLNNGNNI